MTKRASNYAAKVHSEAEGNVQFRAQEVTLRAQGKNTVKQQLHQAPEPEGEAAGAAEALGQGRKGDSGQEKRSLTPKVVPDAWGTLRRRRFPTGVVRYRPRLSLFPGAAL
ncbi:hypothetical protein BGZ92_010902, partial [Podila epicladia]